MDGRTSIVFRVLGGLLAAYLVATNLPFLSRNEDAVFGDARAVIIGGAAVSLGGLASRPLVLVRGDALLAEPE